MRILVLEHERSAHSGLFADWAGDRGHTLEVVDVPALADWPDPRTCDAVLALGSDCSVHSSPDPWIAEEIAFLGTAHETGVPVLGICFGAQALSKALGGEVRQAREVQLGWTTLPSRDAALIPPGPWFRWHEDVFSVPAGAREIVRAGDVPLAFAARRSVGLQFHPEADTGLVCGWLDGGRRKLTDLGIDAERLRDELVVPARGAAARAYDLFDRIGRLWASTPGEPDRPSPIQ
jgi:GMP synthase-like glutamine amidotransferase